MSDSDILRQMIRVSPEDVLRKEGRYWTVRLKEPSARSSSVVIRQVPDDAIVIRADKLKKREALFKGEKGERSCADYIIISEKKNMILYIELKAWKAARHKIVKQLKGARCVAEYCKQVGREFWDENSFLSGYKHRYVSFSHASLVKKKMKVDDSAGKNTAPERVLKISHPGHVTYGRLTR